MIKDIMVGYRDSLYRIDRPCPPTLKSRSVAPAAASSCFAGGGAGFTKATVQRYRLDLEGRALAPSSINLRLVAIKKLAAEAADLGPLRHPLRTSNTSFVSRSRTYRTLSPDQ